MPKRTPVTTIRDSDGKTYHFKLLTASTAKTAMRPYAAELGLLANAWNNLHTNLASLFTLLLAAKNPYVAQALWHSLDSDVAQRRLLRALIAAESLPSPLDHYKRALTEPQAADIIYILEEIDQSLRHKRNNAIHAPLVLFSGVHRNAVRTWAEAHFNTQNPRAKPLRGLDLIEEFRNYTAELERLATYALQMWQALSPLQFRHASWPQRPPSPQAHNKTRKGHRGIPRLPAHRLKS
jgi:hypothetical protein